MAARSDKACHRSLSLSTLSYLLEKQNTVDYGTPLRPITEFAASSHFLGI